MAMSISIKFKSGLCEFRYIVIRILRIYLTSVIHHNCLLPVTDHFLAQYIIHIKHPRNCRCRSSCRNDKLHMIGFEQFKKIDTKITIASGGYKAQTVLSALKGKLIDVLIIDYQLGRRIMELYRTEAEK